MRLSTRLVGFLGCLQAGLGAGCIQAAVSGCWPSWRGDGSGVSAETDAPLAWTPSNNIAWRTALPGEGNSSPIVWSNRVFVTASTATGALRHVICLSAEDGSIVWRATVERGRETRTYPKTGFAAPTPATDGRRVYAFFDTPGLVAVDVEGTVVWTAGLGPFKSSYNVGGSPIVYRDRVILCCDHGGDSFVTALESATGRERWRTPRATREHYSTPVLVPVGNEVQLVINANPVIAYDPETGVELWRCGGATPTVSPSCVFGHGLVYSGSGRNGPVMGIDPTGRGDVTETHLRMFLAAGGPYVPSPLVYPWLFVPGDNGACSVVRPDGTTAGRLRLRGHFTASPIGVADRIYWTDEDGRTAVLDVSRLEAGDASLPLLALNPIGERVLASPAIAGGRLYLRGESHLFCIAGGAGPAATPRAAIDAPGSLEEIQARYEAHHEPEGPDVAVRLSLVASLEALGDPRAVPLLKQIVQEDNHWDVSEEAAKVLGAFGTAAAPALIELLEWKDGRPYPKIIASGHLGRLQVAAAVPALVGTAAHRDPLVRIAALDALSRIGTSDPAVAAAAGRTLIAALDDADGRVRHAAVEGLAPLAGGLTAEREGAIVKALDRMADRNLMVARAARRLLADVLNVEENVILRDERLYGEPRKDSTVAELRAGPLRVKFQDGELRYIRVGGKELIRRIYFAVRDGRWDTVMPEFSSLDITDGGDAFQVAMTARCRNDIADFQWTGRIEGKADGTITVAVDGKAGMDFRSPRVGLNVLYGVESLAGQAYTLTDADGVATNGQFPVMISAKLLAARYRSLRYTTPGGVEVLTELAATDFGMEDQRNFGDSSYKAFSGFALPYPQLSKGDAGRQRLTVKATLAAGPADAAQPAGRTRATVGGALSGRVLPALVKAPARGPAANFRQRRRELAASPVAGWVVMEFNPAAHLPDEDTFMENIPCVVDQIAALRELSPEATFHVGPITIDSPYPRPGPDPRNRGQFAAAWAARMVKYLALGRVAEARFALGAGPADGVLERLGSWTGKTALGVDVDPHGPVDVLAVEGDVCLVNKTAVRQTVELLLQDGGAAQAWDLEAFEVRFVAWPAEQASRPAMPSRGVAGSGPATR